MSRKRDRNKPCPCGSGRRLRECCLYRAFRGPNSPDPDRTQQPFPDSDSKHYFRLKGEQGEAVVHELADKTFLTDWCFKNPKWPDGKELCDLLVVFDDIAIIWQIKNLTLGEDGKYKQSEVEKNLRQVSGARRKLIDLKSPIDLVNPRRGKEPFDATGIREVFLISVLLGEGEDTLVPTLEVKDHVVHVHTRAFTESVLNELDTVSDFIAYLRERERFYAGSTRLMVSGGEEEVLAWYLRKGKSLAELENADYVFVEEGLWAGLRSDPQYLRKKEEDRISYGWDHMINRAHEGGGAYERIARELARPNRFERRCLAKAFWEAHVAAHKAAPRGTTFRRVGSHGGVTYAFLFQENTGPREDRVQHLTNLCLVARGVNPENPKVVGIATEMRVSPTCFYDYCLYDKQDWTQADQTKFEELQKATGILLNPTKKLVHEDEYPSEP